MTTNQIENYCNLLLESGVNIKPGQKLQIKIPVAFYEFGNTLSKIAYQKGVSEVLVKYTNDELDALNINNIADDVLVDIDEYIIAYDKYLVKHGIPTITLVSPRFDDLDIDVTKQNKLNQALIDKASIYRTYTTSDKIAWCIAALPNQQWADKIFGKEDGNLIKLDNLIAEILHLDDEPIKYWNAHMQKLSQVSDKLNQHRFDKIHITTGLGTDAIIGLVDDHKWKCAGQDFIANIPTAEVYTMPHKYDVTGVIVSSFPLVHNNHLYEKLTLSFSDGELININGDGAAILDQITHDAKNGRHLGELALVDKQSPIFLSNATFYNTLYDENAASHIALGNAFASNLENYDEDNKPDSMNVSDIHIDIVFGTEDINVVGIKKNGDKIRIMESGEFII